MSNVIPYGVFALLLVAGIYLLHKGLTVYLGGDQGHGLFATVKHVVGISSLLAGVTVMARIPRLTRRRHWHVVAFLVFLATSGLFVGLQYVPPSTLGPYLDALQKLPWMPKFVEHMNDQAFAFLAVGLGFIVACIAFQISDWKPAWKMWPLIVTGAIALFAFVVARINGLGQTVAQPLWPVLLAFIAFCLLWRMAALCFDLTFVWHIYVRMSVASAGLRGRQWDHVRKWERGAEQWGKSAVRPSTTATDQEETTAE